MITSQNFDLVSVGKEASVVAKNLPSNYSIGQRKNVWCRTNDFNCGLKAYKNIVVKTLKFLVKCTDTFLFWQNAGLEK
jgi:hypothetical protein